MKNHQHEHIGKTHTQEKLHGAAIFVEDALIKLEVATYVARTVIAQKIVITVQN